MKRSYLGLFLFGLLLLVAVMTNPNQVVHEEALKAKVNSYLQKSMTDELSESNNEWEQAGQALGFLLGGAIIDKVITNVVTVDNYVGFSTTKISWGGESRVVGIGIFGNVFLTSKLDEALNEGLLTE